MNKVVLIGAGGKMGLRLTRNLKKSDYQMSYIEISESGAERLAQLDIKTNNKNSRDKNARKRGIH